MSTKLRYHPLNDESHSDHLSLHINPDSNLSKTFLYRQDKDPKQALKEKCKIQHQFTFESKSKDIPIQPSELWDNIRKLKQLKSLKRLNFDLGTFFSDPKLIHKFFEPLKHLKTLKTVHFYLSKDRVRLGESALLHLCKAIRNIPLLPSMEIKFSLTLNKYSSNQISTNVLKSLSQHRCFTSAFLAFEFCPEDSPQLHELLEIMKKSKSLSKLSISFYRCEIDPAENLQALFDDLKRTKSLRFIKVDLRECDSINYRQLRELAPKLREISKRSNVEIVFDNCFGRILLDEWEDFVESIQNKNSPNKISAKFIGNITRVRERVCATITALVAGVVAIFVILLLCYLNQK